MDEDRSPDDVKPTGPNRSLERLEPESSPTPAGMAVYSRIWRSLSGWQDRRIWLLLFGRMVTAIGFSLFFPFLAIYLHTERGVGMDVVGLLFLVNGIAGALAKVHGGILADRLGRKKVMGFALLLRGAAILGLSGLTAIEADVIWIAGTVVFSSYAGHFFIPAAHAMIADLTAGEKRVEGYGLFRVATNFGWAVGPLLGGGFPPSAYPTLLLVTGGVYVAAAAMLLIALAESAPEEEDRPGEAPDLPSPLRNAPFVIFGVVITMSYTVMGQIMSSLPAFTVEFVGLKNHHVGRLFALNGFLVIVFQLPLASLVRRSGMRMTTALLAGSILYAAGYLWVGFALGFWHLAAAMVVITFAEMVVQPTGLALDSNFAPVDQRGRYLGTFGLFNHLGWSLGPFLGGLGLKYFADVRWLTWACVAALSLIAGVGFVAIRAILPPAADRPATAAAPEEK